MTEAMQLSRSSVPLQQHPDDARLRMLIVGDSTGVGTGAASPMGSVAGYLAQEYPRLHIDNRSKDGARFAQVIQQLAAPQAAGERYDLVLIMAGGNDVIRATSETRLRRDLAMVFDLAAQIADETLVMPPGNVGNAPFFFAPLSGVMSRRSENLHMVVKEVATAKGVGYVNLYQPRELDPFVTDIGLNAADGLHPSERGYALWYQELMRQTAWAEQLRSAR